MTATGSSLAGVRAITCPACGGGLVVPAGRRAAPCPSCRTRCALLGEVAEQRMRIVPLVDATRAMVLANRALQQWPVDAGAQAAARFHPPELVYVPVCEYEALEAGTLRIDKGVQRVRRGRVVLGEGRPSYVDDAGRPIDEAEYYHRRLERLYDTRVILSTFRTRLSAAGPEDWRLDALDLDALRDDPDVRVLPFGSVEAAEEERRGALVLAPRRGRAEARGVTRRGGDVTGRVEPMAEEVRLVFVPVWLVRWSVGRHAYAFVVDGVKGRILHGVAPEARRRGALFVGLVAAAIGFPVGKFAAVMASGRGPRLQVALDELQGWAVVAVVAAFVLLVPIAYAWGEFRYRGEVRFSPEGVVVRKIARPAETGIERFIRLLSEWVEQSVMKSRDERD